MSSNLNCLHMLHRLELDKGELLRSIVEWNAEFRQCANQGCSGCLNQRLPGLAKNYFKLGAYHFLRGDNFVKAFDMFHESIQRAALWKSKAAEGTTKFFKEFETARLGEPGGRQKRKSGDGLTSGRGNDTMTDTLTDILTFLISNYSLVSLVGTTSYLRFNDLLFSMVREAVQDESDILRLNVQRVAKLLLAQMNVFLEYLETKESLEMGLDVARDFLYRVRHDLPELQRQFDAKMIVSDRLAKVEWKCRAVVASFEARRIMAAVRHYRQTMSADTLSARLRLGVWLLPQLERAEKTLEPYLSRNPNLLGELLTDVGEIHLDLLQDFDAAERKFEEAKRLEDLLEDGTPFPGWTSRASAGLRLIFSILVNPPILDLDKMLPALRDKYSQGERHFLEYILLRHPPKHSKCFVQSEWSSPLGLIDDWLRLNLMKLYQSDRLEQTRENRPYLKIVDVIGMYLRSFLGAA